MSRYTLIASLRKACKIAQASIETGIPTDELVEIFQQKITRRRLIYTGLGLATDMTGNYKSLVEKICPNAVVTVDRFHVTKIIHEELNQARIAEKKADLELNVKSREKVFDSLKGNKYTILKAEDNLMDKQKIKLNTIREASPLITLEAHDTFLFFSVTPTY